MRKSLDYTSKQFMDDVQSVIDKYEVGYKTKGWSSGVSARVELTVYSEELRKELIKDLKAMDSISRMFFAVSDGPKYTDKIRISYEKNLYGQVNWYLSICPEGEEPIYMSDYDNKGKSLMEALNEYFLEGPITVVSDRSKITVEDTSYTHEDKACDLIELEYDNQDGGYVPEYHLCSDIEKEVFYGE